MRRPLERRAGAADARGGIDDDALPGSISAGIDSGFSARIAAVG
jgi:hypothetical protein